MALSLPRALRARFDRLLFTWDLRQLRRGGARISAPPSGHDWQLQLESRYGDGHYEDRQVMLSDALRALWGHRPPVDFDRVYEILERARYQARIAALAASAIDADRYTKQHFERLWTLPGLIDEALDFLRAFKYSAVGLGRDQDPPLVQALRACRQAFEADPLLKVYRPPARVRRPRPGHQPEPWLRQARRDLAAAGVAPGVRDDLLIAVGLIPHRHRP